MKTLFVLLFTLAIITTPLLAQVSDGEEAPDFTLTSLQNTQITLSDLEGKVVYIFFFGSNCPHCRSNGPVTENEIHQMFKDHDNFIALGIDTWNTSGAEVINFKNATGITYSLLLDGRNSLVDYYGNSSAYDRSVVIAADGTIAYKGSGFVNTDFEDVNTAIENSLSVATSSEHISKLPSSIHLDQNFPNPFNPSTTISYSLPEAAEVSIKIYNMLGVEVATIEKGFKTSGGHTFTFDASNLSSGIYIYRLVAGNISLTKRMTLLK